ncbi:hypothetical protein K488DRAFT_37642, partial [Vararia minispora EC-137]
IPKIMDFSGAQSNGFREAYVRFRIDRDPNHYTKLSPELQDHQKEMWSEEASQVLRGCDFHWKNSIIRVGRTAALVPVEQRAHFRSLTERLTTVTDPNALEHCCRQLYEGYPHLHHWFSWWLCPDVARMIFPAFNPSMNNLWSHMPTTSNAIEAQHSLIH